MKYSIFAVIAIVGLLLVGCADQSNVISPTGVPTQAAHHASPSFLDGSTNFDIDEIVVDETTGKTFSVTGVISCVYTSYTGHYVFTSETILDVADAELGSDQKASIADKESVKGKGHGEFEIDRPYQLSELTEGSMLYVRFNVGDEISIQSIRLVMAPSGN